MNKTCPLCNKQFHINQDDIKLYKRFNVPPEELCFKCSQMQRLLFRNERCLYKRKCDFSGEEIISIYSPESPYKVYKAKYWYEDEWDAIKYGRDFDFNKTFTEQFKALQLEVPRIALINVMANNSEFGNMTYSNKNCYLVFGGDYNEDVQYGTLCQHSKDSLDIDYLSNHNELCYYMSDSNGCYGSQYTFDSKNCNSCYFISDCISCNECILCTNLINKSYCISNKQYSKEEYMAKKNIMLNGSRSRVNELMNMLNNLKKNRIVKNYHGLNCENCTGDYIKNSKNCINCYNTNDAEDVRNSILAFDIKDAFNVSYTGHKVELAYGTLAVVTSTNILNSYFVFDSNDIEYSEQIINSSNLFGCIGLNHKKHCILNKQYNIDEYKNLREKIINHMKKTGEWGKFFATELSCFAYNESTAHQYFPLTKDQALAKGFRWKDSDQKEYVKTNYTVPDNIADTPNDIVNSTLTCLKCGKNYKINGYELSFYKKSKLPVPDLCAECRHSNRLKMRNPIKLYDRNCAKCGRALKTTYAPNRSEKILCEQCYLKEVV